MTREEFYLKAMLAMASNPNYVEVKPCEDEPSETTHILLTEEIQMDAERLTNEAIKSWPEAFDKESNNAHLEKAAEALRGLDENGVTMFSGD